MTLYAKKISNELSITEKNVNSTIELLEGGATVPFIARYRKEATGNLDEVAIAAIRDRHQQLQELDKRKDSVLKSISEQGKLTDDLKIKIENAESMVILEDLYLPFKPKRRSRGTIAKEKGLEPLAVKLLEQSTFDIVSEAQTFVSEEKGVLNEEDALAGARDIIAEYINEHQEGRSKIRELFFKNGTFKSRVIPGKESEGQKYKDYFEWEEPVSKAPSHRVLAMRRGEKEMILMLDVLPKEEDALSILESIFLKSNNDASNQVKISVKDSYKRLMRSSIETEVRLATKLEADKEAIRVFSENLKQLLLAPPLGQKNILAIDPGFRTGCKVVCLDKQGKMLDNTAIYPHEPQKKQREATETILHLVKKYDVEAIAIGNGTAGRETESFIRGLKFDTNIPVIVVNESGASIYSASDVAREEFPDYDVTVRGAVSIGRRLLDPLAELVKIDPKSIGVGQYQHDVDQNLLRQSLDDVVMSCVNAVGVEVNTASKQILTYVSGLGPQLAQNIVDYRNNNGPFKNREALRKVPRMGEKAFEQSAGFLRIKNSDHPLDASAVHPESYYVIDKMASDLKADLRDLITKQDLRKKIELNKYISESLGLPTLNDIMAELVKPGRDPREKFEVFSFTDGVNSIADLRPGMKLPGIVTNVTKFGAFVDIGVHQDGLVHISHLSDKFISDPATAVKVQQKVQVTVLEVDVPRKRISLSLKSENKAGEGNKSNAGKKKEMNEGNFEDKLSQLAAKFKK